MCWWKSYVPISLTHLIQATTLTLVLGITGAACLGEPGGLGANCKYLGNVLILIQSSDAGITIPNDNIDGGSICFDFFDILFAQYFSANGLLGMVKMKIIISTRSCT